jgi:Terminase RNaseH-like domain
MKADASRDPFRRAPETREELRRWLAEAIEVSVPERGMIAGHDSPLEYLAHAFFEGRTPGGDADAPRAGRGASDERRDAGPVREDDPQDVSDGASGEGSAVGDENRRAAAGASPVLDCVVWANRGGGKTFLGAVATLLDLLFKPGIEIRILGGSMEQSQRMHAYLRRLLAHRRLRSMVAGRITDRRVTLANGSSVELLAQSQTSVRGTRVQKLRCDEVELFDPDVWEAAQLVTRSKACGGRLVRGAVECLSTMHLPQGIMHRIVGEAREGKRRLFKWGVVDVLERCGDEHRCEWCSLRDECAGRAKTRPGGDGGHVSIEDARAMKSRVSRATWESEMLCLRPTRTNTVLPEFDPSRHVVREEPEFAARGEGTWIGGMDFGMRAPTVVLWACVSAGGEVWVLHERSERGAVLERHIAAIRDKGKPALSWIAIDPAGESNNDQSGLSNAAVMRRAGLSVKSQSFEIFKGLALVRARLSPADSASPRLYIHERCATLIESMERYCYPAGDPESATPEKGKGFDHAVDALRYMIQWLDSPRQARRGNYAGFSAGFSGG